jgi:hypothetical protein
MLYGLSAITDELYYHVGPFVDLGEHLEAHSELIQLVTVARRLRHCHSEFAICRYAPKETDGCNDDGTASFNPQEAKEYLVSVQPFRSICRLYLLRMSVSDRLDVSCDCNSVTKVS